MIYYLVPRLWKTKIYSEKLSVWHFWLGTIGIVIYVTSMWTAGITQGLMWRQFKADGTLMYPNFLETVITIVPYYWIRALGGFMYLVGVILSVINVFATIAKAKAENADLSDPEFQAYPLSAHRPEKPLVGRTWHYVLEGKPLLFSFLVLVAVIIGGAVEIIPMISVASNVPSIPSVKPYTPLELEGRDIYIREGCYNSTVSRRGGAVR